MSNQSNICPYCKQKYLEGQHHCLNHFWKKKIDENGQEIILVDSNEDDEEDFKRFLLENENFNFSQSNIEKAEKLKKITYMKQFFYCKLGFTI